MPILLAMVMACAVALHLWWQRRYARLQGEFARQKQASSDSQQKHYQQTVQNQVEQQALFNSMTEGVLILDSSGHVQLVNESLRRFFGLKTEVRGQTLMEALRLQELTELVRRVQQEGVIEDEELEIPGSIGRWLHINAAAILDGEGQQHGSILVFHDLTRLKQLENTRREFVANVSHELRTPLSLIKGFVETLLDGAKNDPEVATRFLRTIEKHADRLTCLIEDLLTISQLESGQIVMNLHEVNLREEVDRVVEDLKARADAKNVNLKNQFQDLLARADANRLQQVLYNLIENAIKYGRADGTVLIGGALVADNKIQIWVRDDGPGIPAEARARVFERFYRVDRARSRETGGTGLGLSIVKHIVQAHGSDVSVKSEAGTGTTFSFFLPRA